MFKSNKLFWLFNISSNLHISCPFSFENWNKFYDSCQCYGRLSSQQNHAVFPMVPNGNDTFLQAAAPGPGHTLKVSTGGKVSIERGRCQLRLGYLKVQLPFKQQPLNSFASFNLECFSLRCIQMFIWGRLNDFFLNHLQEEKLQTPELPEFWFRLFSNIQVYI